MPMKRWVVCADGTWNEPKAGRGNTNVVKLARAVQPFDETGTPQTVYYHKGVGERGGPWDHLTGGAFGNGIDGNIEDLYLFLANNYSPSDELFLFGFSRGAYTVRSLAGLIRNSGLLTRRNMGLYRQAFDLYRRRDPESAPAKAEATAFRQKNSWPDFNIRFIGVWDTVGSLGIPVTPLRFWSKEKYKFHDVTLTSHVDAAFQALAIDEKRGPFKPSVWKQQQEGVGKQAFEQAWFPGMHCNVGGGYRATGLSDGALVWMSERARSHGLALGWPQDAAPDPRPDQTPMENSMTFMYRMLRPHTRQIGTAGPEANETLHTSAQRRVQHLPDYRPPNLIPFLRRDPPPPVSTP